MVPQKRPVGAHDQHVDDVKEDANVILGRVAGKPSCRGDLQIDAGNLAALEAAFVVLGCGDVDEYESALVVGDQVDGGSLGGTQPVSRRSKPLRSMKRMAVLTAFS